jgi:hypothetical protein
MKARGRTTTQYRLTWQRAIPAEPAIDGIPGLSAYTLTKSKTFASLPAAKRYILLLTSDEPWKAFREHARKAPDDLACCDGWECSCGGETVRDHFLKRREGLPPLVGPVRIEARTVTRGAWTEVQP